jgi:chemotaxis signal transduction protein
MPASRPVDEQWVAVLADADAPVGLLADAAEDIVEVPAGELSTAPEAGGLVAAVAPGGVLVLDGAALLRDPRLSLSPSESRPDPTQEPSWHDA